jgi:hypothetical protein
MQLGLQAGRPWRPVLASSSRSSSRGARIWPRPAHRRLADKCIVVRTTRGQPVRTTSSTRRKRTFWGWGRRRLCSQQWPAYRSHRLLAQQVVPSSPLTDRHASGKRDRTDCPVPVDVTARVPAGRPLPENRPVSRISGRSPAPTPGQRSTVGRSAAWRDRPPCPPNRPPRQRAATQGGERLASRHRDCRPPSNVELGTRPGPPRSVPRGRPSSARLASGASLLPRQPGCHTLEHQFDRPRVQDRRALPAWTSPTGFQSPRSTVLSRIWSRVSEMDRFSAVSSRLRISGNPVGQGLRTGVAGRKRAGQSPKRDEGPEQMFRAFDW